MFKKIPGNGEFEMNYEGNVRKVDGSECEPIINDGFITLELYGKTGTVCVEWLKTIVIYEVNLPEQFVEDFFKIKQVNIVSHLPYKRFDKENGNLIEYKRPDRIIRFNKPLVVNKRFRIIPCYPRYAISREGEIVETFNPGVTLDLRVNLMRRYKSVKIYDPVLGKKTRVLIHRLLAMAWLPSGFVFDKTFVNHKDGDKLNNEISNLEWVTPQENCNHAFDSDLRSDNKPCKIRDRITGEIREFRSLQATGEFLGRKKGTGSIRKSYRETKIYNDRYEIRMEGDERPWLYENQDEYIIPGRYIIFVTKDNETKKFTDVRSLIWHYKLWNIPSQGIETVIDIMKQRFPEVEIEVIDNHLSGPYQALNIETKEVKTFNKLREMAEVLKIDRSTITKVLRSKEPTKAYGYSFRTVSDDPWSESFKDIASQSTRILVVNSSTNEEREFESIKATARFFKVDKNTIKKKLEKQLPIDGFELMKVA